MTIEHHVLVTYASKYGATAEIAAYIGEELRHAGLRVDVLPVERVSDLSPYTAVVLGSAVYAGHWRRAAAAFLKAQETALLDKPVWLFSSGPTGEGDAATLLHGWRLPTQLQPIADRIAPRDIAIFHGAVNHDKLNLLDRWIMRTVKAPAGDFRDWAAITAWATAIATTLRREGIGQEAAPEAHGLAVV